MKVSENNFVNEVVEYNGKVLVDFYADWCGPCKMLAPVLEEIEKERTDVKVVKVNVDECPSIAAKYGVMSIPTLLVFENGSMKNQSVGFRPKNAVLSLL